LSTSTILLTADPQVFRLSETLHADRDYLVCLVLAAGVDYSSQAEMDARYQDLMQDAKPTASISGPDGIYRFSELHQMWSKSGQVSGGKELAACLSPDSEVVPQGHVMDTIRLQSNISLKLIGAYWMSVPKI